MRARLQSVEDVEGGVLVTFLETFETEGQAKPACVAEALVMYFD
jgi:acyl dehydratase